MSTALPGADVAAWVDGVPVPVAEVAAEVDRLRAGPAGARLPRDGTLDGRQLRRWVTQRLVLRLLLERECAARGLDPAAVLPAVVPDPAAADPAAAAEPAAARAVAPDPPAPVVPDAALLGTAIADVLAVSAAARAVFAAVTGDVRVPAAEVRAQHERDRRTRPERWTIRQAFSATTPPTTLPPPASVDPATLLPEVRTAAAALLPGAAAPLPEARAGAAGLPPEARAGAAVVQPEARAAAGAPSPEAGAASVVVRSVLGWHLIAVDAVHPAGEVPFAETRAAIKATLLDRARQAAFARWVDAAAASRIRLAPGYEHPADPGNSDATHRH